MPKDCRGLRRGIQGKRAYKVGDIKVLELKEFSFENKEEADRFLSRKNSKNSEFTFTNMFMWRKSYDMKYAVINDMFCVFPKHANGPRSATFPIGDGDIKPVIDEILRYFAEIGETPLIRIYDDEAAARLLAAYPDKFVLTEDVPGFDYVYRVQDLINLSGKKYHSKKNHVNRFMTMYDWEYAKMTPADRGECKRLYEEWFENKSSEIEGLEEEREAVFELLDNWERLDIVGGCIRVDGRIIAFSFGEKLCDNMVVIHLEHADTEYRGAFAAMNKLFLENEWSEFEFVNREEDMGLPGLRTAKESYRPCERVKKYVATLANTESII